MSSISRRSFVAGGSAFALAPTVFAGAQSTPVTDGVSDLVVIDLPSEPVNIHPARAYSDIEWSVVHSIFDALVGFDADGQLLPIAAERFELIDDLTWEAQLRAGMTFHDGSPVTSAAIANGFDLLTGSDSLVSDIFGVVSSVDVIDELTARIVVSAPSPWLPSQMATWHVLVPDNFDADALVGSGPYQFSSYTRGDRLDLKRFSGYEPSPVKGQPIAATVSYRFVPDATTRISNVRSGSSDIASFLPFDALSGFDGDTDALRSTEVAGSSFIRIATDTAPFDDVRVRKALNLALDVDAFVGVLVHDGCRRVASLPPGPMAMGYDPTLEPFAYDPDSARSLLAEAGFADGLAVQLEVSTDASTAVCEAIIGQWADVGINAELVVSDMGTFNATWTESSAPPLRMASWSPLFDPSTLLNLVWQTDGILSRYGNPEVDSFIQAGGTEFGDERYEAYREAFAALHNDAAGVFLWSLMNVAAVTSKAEAWTPRPDQWVLALAR